MPSAILLRTDQQDQAPGGGARGTPIQPKGQSGSSLRPPLPHAAGRGRIWAWSGIGRGFLRWRRQPSPVAVQLCWATCRVRLANTWYLIGQVSDPPLRPTCAPGPVADAQRARYPIGERTRPKPPALVVPWPPPLPFPPPGAKVSFQPGLGSRDVVGLPRILSWVRRPATQREGLLLLHPQSCPCDVWNPRSPAITVHLTMCTSLSFTPSVLTRILA